MPSPARLEGLRRRREALRFGFTLIDTRRLVALAGLAFLRRVVGFLLRIVFPFGLITSNDEAGLFRLFAGFATFTIGIFCLSVKRLCSVARRIVKGSLFKLKAAPHYLPMRLARYLIQEKIDKSVFDAATGNRVVAAFD